MPIQTRTYPIPIRKIYLLAMFIQRPNGLFQFDHVEWEVIFGLATFTCDVGDYMRLHGLYEQLQVEEICSWTRAVMRADFIISTGANMFPNVFNCTKQNKVNWGRDGF